MTPALHEDTMIPASYLDPKVLYPLADKLHTTYVSGKPFPHISIESLLPEAIAERLLAEFPSPTQIRWLNKTHEHSKKLACNDVTQMGPYTRHMFGEFNSAVFITFLERLTGIQGLVPDPHLIGGGLHQSERGGKLDIHADFNCHEQLKLDRRLNVLLYLNKDWKEEYGGHFELWNRDMTKCEKKILPSFNRLALFTTSDYSYHGLPDPINCPEGWTRKSLALYYYTNGRPASEVSDSHDTLYQARPGEKHTLSFGQRLKRWIPPALLDLAKAARK